jgi:hypothetical protein
MKKIFLCFALTTTANALAMEGNSKIAFWVFSAKLNKKTTEQIIIDDIDRAYGGNAPLSINPIETIAYLRLKDTRESILKKLQPYSWFKERTLFCDSTGPQVPSLKIKDIE